MKEYNCNCQECQNACKFRPGWFLPEQVEQLYKYFKVNNIEELLKKGFAIDWWNSENDILILAPNIKNNENNIQYPDDPRNECVFYNNKKCDIYDVRPIECRAYIHNMESEITQKAHESIAMEWQESLLLEKFESKIHCGTLNFLGALF